MITTKHDCTLLVKECIHNEKLTTGNLSSYLKKKAKISRAGGILLASTLSQSTAKPEKTISFEQPGPQCSLYISYRRIH